MIAHIDKEYIQGWDLKWIAELIATIAENRHLIDCDNEVTAIIEKCVKTHCSTVQSELINNTPIYEITSLKREHLTTVNVDGTLTQQQYLNLFRLPSLVILENDSYEWPVYTMMMGTYKRDREYQTIYKLLRIASTESPCTLIGQQAGGNGMIKETIESKESSPDYNGLTLYKVYAVTDSDRDSDSAQYGPTQKSVFRYLSGIVDKNSDVDRRLIDTLHQPHYSWHMWRKRAIENYFPPEAYEALGLNAINYRNLSPSERSYVKLGKVDNGAPIITGYKKKDLKRLAENMSRDSYERICDKIQLENKQISEIRLFLLKMAKVV